MDMARLGFHAATFDSFVLETYGSQPSLSHTLRFQRELARVLKPGGIGLISACRRKYPSYWYLMGSFFPPPMQKWLVQHSQLDFCFAEADVFEETLFFGLLHQTHTTESLATELGAHFEIVQCQYDSDPRYLTAWVKPKPRSAWGELPAPPTSSPMQPVSIGQIEAKLCQFEQIAELLMVHTAQVKEYFLGRVPRNPIHELSPDIDRFVDLLISLLPSRE
jgi:hypothetical protein